MTITRVQAETILVKRCGPMMAAANMDGATVDGSNADLDDPLGWAVRRMGGTVADPVAVTDADLATIVGQSQQHLLDVAEYRLLESILTNLELVDISAGPRSESLGQLGARVEKRLQTLGDRLKASIGLNSAPLETGVIQHDFAEHGRAT